MSAVSLSDGRVLAGPLLSHTDPVLSSPRPPPKRYVVTDMREHLILFEWPLIKCQYEKSE